MMTIIGVLTPMRRGIAYKATEGVMGLRNRHNDDRWDRHVVLLEQAEPNPIIDVDTRVGFIVLYGDVVPWG